MNWHIYSGLTKDTGTFAPDIGIFWWCNFDSTTQNYNTDLQYSLVVDTPNYHTTSTISGTINIDGELCGSMPAQSSNTKLQGPCWGVGASVFPTGKSKFVLGCVSLDTYITEGQIFEETEWGENSAGVGWPADGSDIRKSKMPGCVLPSSDHYNVIVPSNTQLGVAQSDTGRRVHWDVATGTLGQFVTKMLVQGQGKLGRIGGSGLGTLSPTMSDELSAGILLCAGYGVLYNDTLAFSTEPTP
tara:strand:+ start:3103 stop:3831 length:729 start_codon:yes stop_codon:yes gene_type:complete